MSTVTSTLVRRRRPQPPRRRNPAIRVRSSTTTNPPTPQTPNSTASTKGSRLSAPLQILQAIRARHRNQHHSQSWWKSLGLLGKWVARIVELEKREQILDVYSAPPVQKAPRPPGAATPKVGTRSKTGPTSDPSRASEAASAKIVRARFEEQASLRTQREAITEWVRDVICPRCYVSFSGLIADSQFANLGVVLMAVVADIAGVVGMPKIEVMVEKPGAGNGVGAINRGDGGTVRSLRLTAQSLRVTGSEAGSVVDRVYDSDDVGEVVERGSGQERTGKRKSLGLREGKGDVREDIMRRRNAAVDSDEVEPRSLDVSSPSKPDGPQHGIDTAPSLEASLVRAAPMITTASKKPHIATPSKEKQREHKSTRPPDLPNVPLPTDTRAASETPEVEENAWPTSTSMTSKNGPSGNSGRAIPDEEATISRNMQTRKLGPRESKMSRAEDDAQKVRKKAKRKKDKNAIDDLFAGFG